MMGHSLAFNYFTMIHIDDLKTLGLNIADDAGKKKEAKPTELTHTCINTYASLLTLITVALFRHADVCCSVCGHCTDGSRINLRKGNQLEFLPHHPHHHQYLWENKGDTAVSY